MSQKHSSENRYLGAERESTTLRKKFTLEELSFLLSSNSSKNLVKLYFCSNSSYAL